MAYIDWWNRTGPVTLGERFGLNEVSPFPYAEGGRIGFDKGGGVKILEYLESLNLPEGTQIDMKDVMKYAKDNKINITNDSISVNIYSTDRKIGGAGPYKDSYVLKDDIRSRWNAIKHKVKVKHKIFDAKNPGTVFKQLDIMLADKAKYPTHKSILRALGYTVQESKEAGRSGLKPILEAYAKDRKVTIPADRFKLAKYKGTQIAADIISNYKTGKFTIADLARNYFPNKVHNDAKIQVNDILRDAGVRDPSEFRNWPGDEPEKWKKVRKERVKKLVERVGVDTAAQTLSLEKQILAKNADILKMTDNEIWNNKKIQKAMNLDVKDLKKNGVLKFDRYKNLSKKEFVAKVRHLANTGQFWQPEHMAGIATEKLHAMFPNEVQAASGKIGSQMDAMRAYIKANPNGKAIPEIEKLLNEFNMQIKSGGKTYGFKEKIIFNSKTGTSNIVEAGTKIFDKGSLLDKAKEVGKKVLRGPLRAVGRSMSPIVYETLAALHYQITGEMPDLTKTEELLVPAFWNSIMKQFNWADKSTDPLKRRILNFIKRGGIPTTIMPLVSRIATIAMPIAETYQAAKTGLVTIPEKEKKIAQIAKDKGWDVEDTLNMYRMTFDEPKLNRETFYKKMFGKMPNLSTIQDVLKSPEYHERKKYFNNDMIEQYFKNKEKVPHPTLRDLDVLEGSVIDKYNEGGLTGVNRYMQLIK